MLAGPLDEDVRRQSQVGHNSSARACQPARVCSQKGLHDAGWHVHPFAVCMAQKGADAGKQRPEDNS